MKLNEKECMNAVTTLVTRGGDEHVFFMTYPYFKIEVDMLVNLIEEYFNDESQIKFYYCESEDSYLIGKRVDIFYYAHWYHGIGFVFDMSRHLPWGEHVVDETSAWKEHAYPSEPKEIDFYPWIKGFIKQIQSYNPPLKFEELKEDMWVWDKKIKWCFLVAKNDIKPEYLREYCFKIKNRDGTTSLIEFEENRFFPVQKTDEVK